MPLFAALPAITAIPTGPDTASIVPCPVNIFIMKRSVPDSISQTVFALSKSALTGSRCFPMINTGIKITKAQTILSRPSTCDDFSVMERGSRNSCDFANSQNGSCYRLDVIFSIWSEVSCNISSYCPHLRVNITSPSQELFHFAISNFPCFEMYSALAD